ncbi:hypothetical protein DdX_12793 [Ditylenchus destructor]|uniref:Uncharacterized protein n=1 Tax=Ditylenchus destructor TaxID=166010 RepID=A0AAD4MXM0_9BILA|nr:hypothetical protein DdX_12793 [Ditylenchus destructor]
MLVEKPGRRQPARSAQLRMNLSIRRLRVSLSIKSRSWKKEVCSIKLQISRSRKDPCRSKRESHDGYRYTDTPGADGPGADAPDVTDKGGVTDKVFILTKILEAA